MKLGIDLLPQRRSYTSLPEDRDSATMAASPALERPQLPPDPHEYNQLDSYAYCALPSPSNIRVLTDLQWDKTSNWEMCFRGVVQPIPKLTCSLRVIDLNETPLYDCVSYTWGNPHRVFASEEVYDSTNEFYGRKVPILCDEKVLWIGQNLAMFLMKALDFNRPDKQAVFERASGVRFSGRLWIDAVCIDQSNDEERAQQVRIMDRVYSNARVVLAWLGEFDGFAEKALESLLAIAQLEENAVEQAKTIDIIHGNMAPLGLESKKPGIPLYAFLKRAYFRRAWILQEAVLANRLVICCGPVMLPFGYFIRTAGFLYRSGWWAGLCDDAKSRLKTGVGRTAASLMNSAVLRTMRAMFSGLYEPELEDWFDPIYVILEIADAKLAFGRLEDQMAWPNPEAVCQRPTYKDIFTRYRVLESIDPRDKIYAFLGIRPNGGIPLAVQPDYSPGTSVRHVFTAATKYLIEENDNLDILCQREPVRSQSAQDLPSWVSDYRAKVPVSIGDSEFSPWRACGDASSLAHANFDGDLLILQGYCMDTVETHGQYDTGDLSGTLEVLAHVRMLDPQTPAVPSPADGSPLAVAGLTSLVQNLALGSTEQQQHAAQTTVGGDSTRSPTSLGRKQTRCEMLWRTLLADCCNRQSPAPLEYGRAFASSLVNSLGTRSAAALRELADSLSPKPPVPQGLLSSYVRAERGIKTLAEMEAEDLRALSISRSHGTKTSPDEPLSFLLGIEDLLPSPWESKDSLPPDPALQDYWAREGQIHDERLLFATARCGYLGYGPVSLEKGDEVWLLAGGKVPFVLRRGAEGTHQLIG